MSAPDRIEPLATAVAVVSFGTRDLLERCLASVRGAAPAETVVVDNGSTDGSIELVRDRFPEARLIVNEVNRGYGAGANQAVAACAAPAVLLLNSDTEIAPGALPALGRYLAEHPSVAVAGPRLVNPDGSLQPSTFGFPSVADMLMADTGLHLLVRRLPGLRERFLRTWSHDAPRPVPWMRGAALAIRGEPFRAVGGFDEDYFMYYEEVDLCRRLRDHGYDVHFAPVTDVVHAGGASTAGRRPTLRREWLASYRRYLARHDTPSSAAAQLALLRALVTARAARDRTRRRLARDAEQRRRLGAGVEVWDALLRERELWKP